MAKQKSNRFCIESGFYFNWAAIVGSVDAPWPISGIQGTTVKSIPSFKAPCASRTVSLIDDVPREGGCDGALRTSITSPFVLSTTAKGASGKLTGPRRRGALGTRRERRQNGENDGESIHGSPRSTRRARKIEKVRTALFSSSFSSAFTARRSCVTLSREHRVSRRQDAGVASAAAERPIALGRQVAPNPRRFGGSRLLDLKVFAPPRSPSVRKRDEPHQA